MALGDLWGQGPYHVWQPKSYGKPAQRGFQYYPSNNKTENSEVHGSVKWIIPDIIRDAMEIDKKKLRDLLLWFWEQTEKAQTDLNAHQTAILLLKAAGEGLGFDQFLQETRKHPSQLLLAMHQEARDTIEALLDGEKTDELLNFLRKWKPRGPIQ